MEQVAAELGPHVDRLALCVHRPASRDPQLRAAVARLELPAGSIMVVAARQLACGRVTLAELELLSRYESRTLVAHNAERHIVQGLLRDEANGFVPSDELQAASALVLRVQADVAAALWAAHAAVLPDVAVLATRFVDAAQRNAGVPTPAFDSQRSARGAVPDTPAGQLLGRVTELRYLRADLHSAALAEHGLAGPRARALGRLWRGLDIPDDLGVALEQRRLATRSEAGWTLTASARSIRDGAEAATNTATANAFASLNASEGHALLDAFAQLPGDDPRPIEDR